MPLSGKVKIMRFWTWVISWVLLEYIRAFPSLFFPVCTFGIRLSFALYVDEESKKFIKKSQFLVGILKSCLSVHFNLAIRFPAY